MHLPPGFLGTRADILMDFVLVAIVCTPFIMYASFRLARKKRYIAHRNLNSILIAIIWLVVVAFEADIRLSGGTAAFVQNDAQHQVAMLPEALRWFFYVHVAVALVTFISWGLLARRSWRAHLENLPGAFSASHMRQGKLIFVGVVFTAVTGALLYVLNFAV